MPTIQELVAKTDRHVVVFNEVTEILVVGNGDHHPWINQARKLLGEIRQNLAAKLRALEDMEAHPDSPDAQRAMMAAHGSFSTSSRSLQDRLHEVAVTNTLGLPDHHVQMARAMLDLIKTMEK